MTCNLNRRQLLARGTAFAGWSMIPALPSLAGQRDARLLFVVLRGGFDGLAGVLPTFDPAFVEARAEFLDELKGVGPLFELGQGFSLPPQLVTLEKLYRSREALFLHAVATPYRARSHFDAQDVLESGFPVHGHQDSGWLNRALDFVKAESAAVARDVGLGIGQTPPLIIRGRNTVLSWAPQTLPLAGEDTLRRLLDLYSAHDPLLEAALAKGAQLDRELAETMPAKGRGRLSRSEETLQMVDGATRLMTKPDGPRIGALSLNGWDTHAFQRPGQGKYAHLLTLLDEVVERLHQGLKPVWRETTVVMVTEFGRTVRINGTLGTDHGTASAAILVGGAVNGGRVLADWPGLSSNVLFEGRDLKPTTDLRSVFKGLLSDHYGIAERALEEAVFPGSGGIRPMRDLLRA